MSAIRGGATRMAGNTAVDDATLNIVAEAVVALDPKPRARRWVSLGFCVADAVWSIGANYDTVVVPLVRDKIAGHFGVFEPTAPADGFRANDPLPLNKLTDLGIDGLTRITNRQRTSTRHGIRKAEAVLQHCDVFLKHQVETLGQAIDMMADAQRFSAVDDALRSIPGEGLYGIRRNYLWMLIGNDDLVKPDRMMLRWLERQGVQTDPAGARDLIAELVPRVRPAGGRRPTAWEIDHAIWLAARKKSG